MKKLLATLLLSIPLVVSAKDVQTQKIKDAFVHTTPIEAIDWYKKGNTDFAEYEGKFQGFRQKIKASVKPNEVHIKAEVVESDLSKDLDAFMLDTTMRCRLVFRDFILPEDKLEAATSWDDDVNIVDDFEFMNAKTLPEVFRHEKDGIPHKTIYGWDVSIQRSAGKTTCSAIKL